MSESTTSYARMIDALDQPMEDAPLPGWAGITTLFGAQAERLHRGADASWTALGVPFDGTTSSRPGAAEGPRAIRAASLIYANSLQSLGEAEMCDMRTGEWFAYRTPDLVDIGDCSIYPTDIERTFRSVAGTTYRIASAGDHLLVLAGDHSSTFPSFAGFWRANASLAAKGRVGFINVDHHFDFGDHSVIHGPLYHGSNSRRISELPGMRPEAFAFVGVGDVTRAAQLRHLREAGYNICSVADVRQHGLVPALRPVVERVRDHCDVVYVSIDIDVLDASVAPGTGNVTAGGLSAAELLDTMALIRTLPVRGLDVTEVAPRYDPTGRTAQLTARFLYEYLFRTQPGELRQEAPR